MLYQSSVLLHLLAIVLCHVIMLLYNSTSSTILVTYANTPCRLFNCTVEIKVLATTEHFATCRRIYSTVVIQLTSCKSTSLPRSWTTSQFCLLSTADRRPPVDSIHPVHFCIIVSSFLHSLVKYYFLSIYIVDPYNKVYFCLSLSMLLFSSVMIIEVVGVLYWKITDSITSHSLEQD